MDEFLAMLAHELAIRRRRPLSAARRRAAANSTDRGHGTGPHEIDLIARQTRQSGRVWSTTCSTSAASRVEDRAATRAGRHPRGGARRDRVVAQRDQRATPDGSDQPAGSTAVHRRRSDAHRPSAVQRHRQRDQVHARRRHDLGARIRGRRAHVTGDRRRRHRHAARARGPRFRGVRARRSRTRPPRRRIGCRPHHCEAPRRPARRDSPQPATAPEPEAASRWGFRCCRTRK